MLITGETGYAVYGNSILSSEFFCELKTILKNKKLIKRKFFVSKGDPLLPEDTEKVSLNWKLPLLPGNFGPLVPGDGPMRNCHLGKVIPGQEKEVAHRNAKEAFLFLPFFLMTFGKFLCHSVNIPHASRPRSGDTGPPTRSQCPAHPASAASVQASHVLRVKTLFKNSVFQIHFSGKTMSSFQDIPRVPLRACLINNGGVGIQNATFQSVG